MKNAVCCADELHCCPENTECQPHEGKCTQVFSELEFVVDGAKFGFISV